MANKSFTNLKELELYLQTSINKVLSTQVSSVIKDELESTIIDMENRYEPSYYERRSSTNSLSSGGLADKETMSSELISSGTLSVTPQADFNYEFAETKGFPSIYGDVDHSRSLVANIVYGYGDSMHPWNIPRDFIEETRENLRVSRSFVEAMKDGLEAIFGVGNVI